METKMKTKTKRAVDQMRNQDITVPWEVSRFIGEKTIAIAGEQACLSQNGDFGTVDEIREALSWMVNQFGGTVNWDKS
jgi:hypothetical protein